MKKITSVAASAAMVASFATGSAIAGENPFAMQEVEGSSIVAMSEGTCGEGKCGGEKATEAKCGAGKTSEGKCGDSK